MNRHFVIVISFFLFNTIHVLGQKKENMEGIEVGDMAPEIELPTIDGGAFKLSQVKGKLVLVSFWASWCGPCRKKAPELLEVFAKYKDSEFKNGEQGFDIVYVSLDKNSDIWKQSIAKDGIHEFLHVGDMKAWRSEAAQTYSIMKIPSSLLLDGEGKIIALNLSPKDLNKKLKGLKKGNFFGW